MKRLATAVHFPNIFPSPKFGRKVKKQYLCADK